MDDDLPIVQQQGHVKMICVSPERMTALKAAEAVVDLLSINDIERGVLNYDQRIAAKRAMQAYRAALASERKAEADER